MQEVFLKISSQRRVVCYYVYRHICNSLERDLAVLY